MPLVSDTLRNLSSTLIAAALIICGLYFGREIFVPLTLAVMIAFVLSPAVRMLTQVRIPRALAVFLTVSATSAIIIAFSTLLSGEIISLTTDIGQYRSNILKKIHTVTGAGGPQNSLARATEEVKSLGTAIQQELKDSSKTPEVKSDTSPFSNNTNSTRQSSSGETGNGSLLDYLPALGQPMAQLALTFLFTIFLILQYQDLRDRVVRVVGTDYLSDTTSAMSEAGSRLSQLFLLQALLNGTFGVFVGLALAALGIPNAALWGAVSAIMRFIPFVGSILAAVPPLLLAAAVDPGWSTFAATAAVFLIGEPIMGHIVEPTLLGKKAGISPFAMVASASFWTLIWGPIGLILAAPLTMTLVVLGRYIKGLEFFSVLLGDEPALSPEQEFYHRLLSEDSITAIEKFETSLETLPPAEAADALVFPALRLAAVDSRNGRLDKDQIEHVSATIMQLSETLVSSIKPKQESNSAAAKNVLLIGARGPIDAAAASFIEELLTSSISCNVAYPNMSSGLTALSSSHEIFEKHGPDIVIVVSVGSSDPSQLKFIAKRAQKEFAGVPVIIFDSRRPSDVRDKMRDDGGQKTSFVCSARELIAQAQSKSSDSLSPADVEGDGAKLDETRLNSQPLAASSAAHAPFPV